MDKRPDSEKNGVELNEAAEIMGSSAEALRKRIQRGSLDGYKVDGRWYVVLPDGYERPDSGRTNDRAQDDTTPNKRQDGGWTRQDISPDASKAIEMLLATKDDMLASKDDEIAFLRRELDARTEEIRRRDHIIAGLAQQVKELPEVSQTLQEKMKSEVAATIQTDRESRASEMAIQQRVMRDLRKEALEEWSLKPVSERMKSAGLFRKVEDTDKREEFVSEYITFYLEDRLFKAYESNR